jgi:hypothetical protein
VSATHEEAESIATRETLVYGINHGDALRPKSEALFMTGKYFMLRDEMAVKCFSDCIFLFFASFLSTK